MTAHTIRRVITYLLLIATVTIAATGVTGLLERLLDSGAIGYDNDNFGLAQSLAFALIGTPLAAVLWWLTWRPRTIRLDRTSITWPLYLVIMSTIAFLTFSIGLFSWIAGLFDGGSTLSGIALPLVWGLIWSWHYWMWRHPTKHPTRLKGVAPAIASLIALTFAVGGGTFALANLIDASVDAMSSVTVVGGAAWQPVAQSLVWAIGGAVVWWWHWYRAGVRNQSTGFAHVLLVYIAGFASLALFGFGATLTLATVLELVTQSPDPLAVVLEPLGIALASAAFGALSYVYHARVVAVQPPVVGSAARLVSSAVALAIVATGVGVTVNALLATLTQALLGDGTRNVLLGGVSALVVGGTLWWALWRPGLAPQRAATPGRRVYLVVIFGLSALVALITLLVIGFQFFSFVLASSESGSFLEHSRQALGLLFATVLVAAYHFALWRGDRSRTADVEPVRRIERVTLVMSGESSETVEAIRDATGARVTVLRRTDAVAGEPTVHTAASEKSDMHVHVPAALDGIDSRHVLVIVGRDEKVEVIPVED